MSFPDAHAGARFALLRDVELSVDVRVVWRRVAFAAAGMAACASGASMTLGKTKAEAANAAVARSQQQAADWLAEVHKRIAAHDLAGAQNIVLARLAAAPQDSDALGWLAQLLAWTGHRAEAETTYRRALQLSPRDSDYLLGLATLLAQDGREVDALALLNAALEIPPPRADVYNERGRVLAALGRRAEARADFLRARAFEPVGTSATDDETAAGLRSLQLPPRFEMDFTNETDTFNYTGAANAQSVVFVAKPNERWTFSNEIDSYQRFGSDAQKDVATVAHRFRGGNWLTVGTGAGNAQGIIPSAEAYFEYDRGFSLSESAPLRSLETSYNQHWLWYQGAHVLVFTATVAADFARGYRWTLSANEARSGFAGTRVAWEPSGYSRLEFPFPRARPERFLPSFAFAVGSENFSELDQVSAFASRTYGSGFRLGVTERQFVNFYFAWQDRNDGRSEGIYGASYGMRF